MCLSEVEEERYEVNPLKNKKKIISMMLACVMCVSCLALTGCGNKPTEEQQQAAAKEQAANATATRELQQNDYRGAIKRTDAIRNLILATIDNMKVNNAVARDSNPNSYWTAKGYQEFVSTFLATEIINDTSLFNEEETKWEEILSALTTYDNNFNGDAVKADDGTISYKMISSIKIVRNEKDDYTVSGVPFHFYTGYNYSEAAVEGKSNYRILYDCDKDWAKAYGLADIKDLDNPITTTFYEYMRIDDNTFVIQTEKERLIVKLAPVEADTDLRERTITEFYYSRLVDEGMRTTFTPFEPLPEQDLVTGRDITANIKYNEKMAAMPYFNEAGDISNRYGIHDSAFFFEPSTINEDNFVFQDKALQQAICYKNGILVVTTYNKLSDSYEQLTYAVKNSDEAEIAALEAKVQIKNLVGILELPKVTDIVDDPAQSDSDAATPTDDNATETTETGTGTESTEENPTPTASENSTTDEPADTAPSGEPTSESEAESSPKQD